MKNEGIRQELATLYGAKCMLTDYKERLTYHHIKKKCDGGKETIANGALLNREAHDLVHYLESNERELYEELNEALMQYKICIDLGETDCLIEFELVKEKVRERTREHESNKSKSKQRKK